MSRAPFNTSTPRPVRGLRHAQRGFTMVEVVMAVGVMALVISTSITTLQRAFLHLDSVRNLEVASRILQCEMEKERMLTWAQVSDASYAPTVDSSFVANPAIAGRFTLSRAIETVADHAGNMLRVTITATWRNYDGRTLQRSFTTYYGKDGLYAYFKSQT